MTDEWYVILNMNCKYEICRRCPKSGLFKGSLKECDDWIKQKQKDEIKDKISIVLKDPILQQGFEVICKENAELDCQMNRNKYCYSCVNATDKCFRNEIGCPCEKYKSYKDENAELKEQCLLLADCNACHSTCKNENVEIKKQLTKAKEIIKDFMTVVKSSHTTVCGVSEENRTINVLKLNKEAEKFLNGEVEK